MAIEKLSNIAACIPFVSIIPGTVKLASGVASYIRSTNYFETEVRQKNLEGNKRTLREVNARLDEIRNTFQEICDAHPAGVPKSKEVSYAEMQLQFSMEETTLDTMSDEQQAAAILQEEGTVPPIALTVHRQQKELRVTRKALVDVQQAQETIKNGLMQMCWPAYPINLAVNYYQN